MIFKGICQDAQYEDQPIVDYQGNPFIEALPTIMSEEEAAMKIATFPSIEETEKALPAHVLGHCVQRINRLVQPLSRHIELEQAVSRLIRSGYIARNPTNPDYVSRLREEDLLKVRDNLDGRRSTAAGFALIGISGIGKSTALERILLTYPQVIHHFRYKEINLPYQQVTWLKLECPHDGSVKGLCIAFFQALDSLLNANYYKKYNVSRSTVDDLLPKMATLALLHGIGVLVIDEIQNLSEAKSGGSEKMLNFFVQMVNSVGLPIIVVGTTKAKALISAQFREARRATGQGDFCWSKLDDIDWDILMARLWPYQWTEEFCTQAEEDIAQVLYHESQGITDIAIKIFMLAQWRAITTKQKKINVAIIKSVAKDSLQLIKPILDALKTGDANKISKYEDLAMNWDAVYKSFGLDKADATILTGDLKGKAKDNVVGAIVDWLVQGGASQNIAHKATVTVLKEAKHEGLNELRQKAARHAFALGQA